MAVPKVVFDRAVCDVEKWARRLTERVQAFYLFATEFVNRRDVEGGEFFSVRTSLREQARGGE